MKTVYCLRIRADESQPWSPPEYFRTRKERDKTCAVCRYIGGIRTHSFEEKKTAAEAEQLLN